VSRKCAPHSDFPDIGTCAMLGFHGLLDVNPLPLTSYTLSSEAIGNEWVISKYRTRKKGSARSVFATSSSWIVDRDFISVEMAELLRWLLVLAFITNLKDTMNTGKGPGLIAILNIHPKLHQRSKIKIQIIYGSSRH
jgi:hypothetical protein